ncbi:MAG: O-antigen ligase family protein, partial [Gammaproteobacteria bacterium]
YVCLTQSRGPILSLLLILLLPAITLVKNGFWKSNLTVALFSIGFILIVITGVDNDFIDGLIRRSDSYRLEIWRQTLSCTGEHLWTGVGIATKFSRSEAGIQLYNQLHVWFLHPHNIFISMLYYGGVLGLACFSVFILMLFKGILSSQSNGRRPCQLITLIGVLMLLATDGYRLISAPREIWLIFWLPITFIIGTSCRETEEEQEQNRAVSAYYDRAPLKL